MEIEKNLHIKILEWAYNKASFTEQDLFNKFPKLNTDLKSWYLDTFRGAKDNDDCLIGVYDDRKGSFYCSLTAKGRFEYLGKKDKWWKKHAWAIIGITVTVLFGVYQVFFSSPANEINVEEKAILIGSPIAQNGIGFAINNSGTIIDSIIGSPYATIKKYYTKLPDRHLSDSLKLKLDKAIPDYIARSETKEIEVTYIGSTDEAKIFAFEIQSYVDSKGWKHRGLANMILGSFDGELLEEGVEILIRNSKKGSIVVILVSPNN